jgi:hypothetical protein
MPLESYTLMDGVLHVYRCEGSRFWQCATYLGSRNHRQTTKETSLAAAKDFAREWYMERCVEDRQRRRGGVPLANGIVQSQIAVSDPVKQRSAKTGRPRSPTGPTFEDAATAFTNEFEVISLGERNAGYVKSKSDIIRVHLMPFFGEIALADIKAGKVQ